MAGIGACELGLGIAISLAVQFDSYSCGFKFPFDINISSKMKAGTHQADTIQLAPTKPNCVVALYEVNVWYRLDQKLCIVTVLEH